MRTAPPLPPVFDPSIALFLEDIYASCALRGRLRRDPLALVVTYRDSLDRELAGLIASTLAFGSVDLIIRACHLALSPLGPSPHATLLSLTDAEIEDRWSGFQYRYCFAKDMTALLRAARRALEASGSLEAFFLEGDVGNGAATGATSADGGSGAARSGAARSGAARSGAARTGAARTGAARTGAARGDIVAATGSFAHRLKLLSETKTGGIRGNLLPEPEGGSACKRLFLFLRWMVRRDAVDPGGWTGVDPSRLVVPMDTHMAAVCSERLGFIPAPKADLRAALAVTAAFRLYAPEDPVKYDFALTRPGIDPEPGDERFECR